MDIQQPPSIGNRSDALSLLKQILEEVIDTVDDDVYLSLEAIKDAIDRGII